jgi:carboxymethylenebutenolidase
MNSFKIDKHISFPINGSPAPGHLVVPSSSSPLPGIVVIQEVFGLNDDIRDIARKFAGEGYAVLAPDLYHGDESIDLEEARKYRMAMDMKQAERELDSAVRYLGALPEVSGLPVGVIGFCMGGGLCLNTAIRSSAPGTAGIGAAAIFYPGGGDLLSDNQLQRIRCPIFGAYGAEDSGMPPEKIRQFQAQLEANGIDNEIHIYQGAGHSFFNTARPSEFNARAAAEAWTHVITFFGRALQQS